MFQVLQTVFSNPSPLLGGILGGLITGGLFGWLTHGRSIRPLIVFFRDHQDDQPKWQLKNIGNGPAMHIRVRDYSSTHNAMRRVLLYPLQQNECRPLNWVVAGTRLEADYTDACGKRWYRSIGEDNDTVFKRRYRSFWRRPSKRSFEGYEPEIHVLRALQKGADKT